MPLFRKSALEGPLSAQMASVKLGDRVLVIGCGDTKLIAAVASKAGLTGRACVVDESSTRLAAAQRTVERDGALVEAATSPFANLPYDAESFDLVIIRDVLTALSAPARLQTALEACRVLRPGGRCMVIDGGPPAGIGRFLKRRVTSDEYVASGGAEAVLRTEGFAAVRTLAERDGMVFVEGIKRQSGSS